MTREFRHTKPCPNCGHSVSLENEWSAWVRAHPELDSAKHGLNIMDGDYKIHRYKTWQDGRGDRSIQYVMELELKQNGAEPGKFQKDLLNINDQILRSHRRRRERGGEGEGGGGKFVPGHSEQPTVVKVKSSANKCIVQVKHMGTHLLTLSKTTPVNSEWMTWDYKPITEEQLIKLLRFELHPDTLKPLELRRHKRKNVQPPLRFGDA